MLSVEGATAAVVTPVDWDVLYEAHRLRLLNIANLILRDREEAADIVQRVFEQTYRHRARLDPSLSPLGWLTRLTCNEAISASRRRQRMRWLPLTGREGAASHEDETIDRLLVDKALKRLRPKHRAVVTLFYLYGYSLADIAVLLDIPKGTVASRLHLARVTLASLTRDHESRRHS